ncbi:MAG: histidine--tRNA ligase [Alphaproteobacteria bacterium]
MFQPARGTRDLLPDECRSMRYVSDTSKKLASLYGFEEVDTPIFEFADVFRHMGETSDVVTKETYTFADRGEQDLTLRPEGTAGVMRAVISNGLTQQTPLKYFYSGPMFRYERPQKGRYRQFHQIGVELLGVASPVADVEVMALGQQIIQSLDLQGDYTLELNSLGDNESRDSYRAALIEYLHDFRSQLSEESQMRLEKNPLRILDSKSDSDQKLLLDAPVYRAHLNAASEDHFSRVIEMLEGLKIPHRLNYRIVRGLDYYCHTAFEFVSDSLGAQGAIIAGGRYDGLVKRMGGSDLPGVGWAGGIDRLALLLQNPPAGESSHMFVPLGEAAEAKAVPLMQLLRNQGLRVEMGYSGNMSKRLKKANQMQAKTAIIIGEDELEQGKAMVRNLQSGDQTAIEFDNIATFLKSIDA